MPGHVPIWANFVVYGPILKISNAMCISNGNLEFSPQMTHYACPGITKDRLCKVAQLYTPNSGRGPRMNFRGQIRDFHKGEA